MITNKEITNQYNIFSNNVKKYRRDLNLTQEQLSEKTGLSLSYIKQIESSNEYSNVTFITLSKLSMAFNISIKELFTEHDC